MQFELKNGNEIYFKGIFQHPKAEPKKAERNFDEYECWNMVVHFPKSLSFNDMAKKKESGNLKSGLPKRAEILLISDLYAESFFCLLKYSFQLLLRRPDLPYIFFFLQDAYYRYLLQQSRA